MAMNTQIGSLALAQKHPGHSHGDGDDQTTTRMLKSVAMANQINLRSPAAASMDKHKAWRRRAIYAAWSAVVIAVAVLALRWMTP
jgi:hypothetical protein